MGNDQNEPTGLYGASGAMRVWSGIFKKLPSSRLTVSNQGLEWAWLADGRNEATDEGCPGARRLPFVAGFAPAYVPCAPVEPEVITEPEQGGGWRSWFGLPPRAAESPQTEPEQP